MPVQYPIRAAAKLTGIAMDTLRAWERRYKAVSPTRTKRGRLYGDADIRRLLQLRKAVESGCAIGQVASLSDAELQELTSQAASPGRKHESGPEPGITRPLLQPLVDSIQSYDYAATNEELGRLALLMSPVELVHRVVVPLMRLAGENWEKGIFQIAHEHLVSACVRNLLGGIVRIQRTSNRAGTLVLTTPAGELHEFGVLAAAMLAVAHGFQVAYLGPNLPLREILFAVEKSEPRAVVLGIIKMNATPAVCDELHGLALKLPAATELWLGGSGAAEVSNGMVRGGVFILEDLAEFEQHLDRLKTGPSRETVL